MSIGFKRSVYVLLFIMVTFLGFVFWLNTVAVEKSKALYSDVILASNAYFMYKKNPNNEFANVVLRHANSRVGRTYAISVLRENKRYDQIGAIYLQTLRDFNNFDMYQTFLYSIDIDIYYRDRQVRNNMDEDYEILGRLNEASKDRLFYCYQDLRKRYTYPWPAILVPYLGRPVENFDYFFDVHSTKCR